MQIKPLGNTGLTVTPIGLGLAALGRPAYVNLGHDVDFADKSKAGMAQQTHDVLDAAWAAGIRWIDAARSYGLSEQFLGEWLVARDHRPDDLTVTSKWGYTYVGNWQMVANPHEVKEHSIGVLTRQWDETQSFIGAHVKAYQIHSATLESGVLENEEVLSRLWELKREGIVIGMSLSGAGQAETLRKALTVQSNGEHLFSMVQATWNLLEPSAGELLSEAHAAGWGVVAKEVVANGRLTPRGASDPTFSATFSVLSAQATRLHTTVDALAIAFAMQQPFLHAVLSGASTVQQLRDNLGALQLTLDDEALDALNGLAEPPTFYWTQRKALPWI